MLQDVYKRFRSIKSAINSSMTTMLKDNLRKPSGEVFWKLEDTVSGEITEGHIKNIVTLDASILVARLIKGTAVANVSEPKFGVYALAVGTGDAGWNPLNPPSATDTQRSLYNELGRKVIASTQFVDSLGNPSLIPTNVVDFTTQFVEAEVVGPLCEMGLIGGDLPTSMASRSPILPPNGERDTSVDVTGMDTLVNYITFPCISKSPTSKLSWTWRISF